MCNTIEIPASVSRISPFAIGFDVEVPRGYRGGEPGVGTKFIKQEGLVIHCYPGTEGEKYAKDNGFEYKLLSE